MNCRISIDDIMLNRPVGKNEKGIGGKNPRRVKILHRNPNLLHTSAELPESGQPSSPLPVRNWQPDRVAASGLRVAA